MIGNFNLWNLLPSVVVELILEMKTKSKARRNIETLLSCAIIAVLWTTAIEACCSDQFIWTLDYACVAKFFVNSKLLIKDTYI